jgi:hypothetical protein
LGNIHRRISSSRPVQSKVNKNLSQEKNKNTSPGAIAQVVEHLPNKYKTMGHITVLKKNKECGMEVHSQHLGSGF